MAHNGVFTISIKGASRMDFNFQWEYEEAPKRGLRNPWNHRPDGIIDRKEVLVEGHHMGWEVHNREATKEEISAWKVERDEYMRQRDEWIALKMFDRYGYETFIEECEAYRLADEFRNSVRPCESHSDSQCSLFCAQYDNCELRLAEGR